MSPVEVYTLSLHDALPICSLRELLELTGRVSVAGAPADARLTRVGEDGRKETTSLEDRKSTRLNSSHVRTSYAVFCLKKIISHHLMTAPAHLMQYRDTHCN